MITINQALFSSLKNPEHQAGYLVLVSRGEARITDPDNTPIPVSRLIKGTSPMARDLFCVMEKATQSGGSR